MTHRTRFAVAGLLAVHFLLAMAGSRQKSPGFDETVHVAAGLAYDRWHDYRMDPENGVLPQRLAGLPLLLGGFELPPRDGEAWRDGQVWEFADQFFHRQGHRVEAILLRSRGMVALLSCLVGALVWAWSRRIFGPAGGLLSLTAYAFSPTLLAHAALATSDLCCAGFFFAASGCLWKLLQEGTWPWALVAGVAVGLAQLSKFSAVLLVPMALVMAVAAWRRRPPTPAWAGKAAVAVALAIAVIWAGYGFRWSITVKEGLFAQRWSETMRRPGLAADVLRFARDHRLLPEAYVYGLALVRATTAQRHAFLNGQHGDTGWWTFFPYAFAVKTSPLTWALAVAAVAVLLRRGRRWRARRFVATPLLAILAVYAATAVASNINIGHRHLLPLYPPLFVLFGIVARAAGRRFERPLLAGAFGLGLATALLAFPHYLAYFNFSVPAESRYRHLVDSSLDWGMDLPGLRRFLAERQASSPVYLAYFGTGSPAYYGIEAKPLPGCWKRAPTGIPEPLRGGTYCISATLLQSLYLGPRGPWTAAYEEEYQALRHRIHEIDRSEGDAGLRRELASEAGAGRFARFEELRFARLAECLRRREPDTQVGYSILIYEVTDEEAHAAEAGPSPREK